MNFRSFLLSVCVLATAILFSPSMGKSQTVFTYTGAPEYWTVPAGVSSLSVWATGAAGASGADGGYGAMITGIVTVSDGDVLEINVGGMGVDTVGGFNGGGAGGSATPSTLNAGGGGGASDVRIPPYALGNRVIVAGGGGGMGGGVTKADGGHSLCPDGATGENGFGPGGTGATTTSQGFGGIPSGAGTSGSAGVSGAGGARWH
ncbi:hypothetical protein JYT74_01580 [Crocinitomix catalasitica]|nr:hypothetical protein [Crocinitomix catalasitica]